MPLQAAPAAQRSQQSSSPNHPAGSSTVAAAQNPSEEELNPEFLDALTRWLVYRQTKTIPEEDFEVRENDFPTPAKPAGVSHNWDSGGGGGESRGGAAPPIFYVQGASTELGVVTDYVLPPIGSQPLVAPPSLDPALHELSCAGFNGRCNKVSDTCYGFWVGGALAVCAFSFPPPTHFFPSTLLSLLRFFLGGGVFFLCLGRNKPLVLKAPLSPTPRRLRFTLS